MTLEEIVKEHKGLTYGLPMQGYTFSELVYYANILAKQESIEFAIFIKKLNVTYEVTKIDDYWYYESGEGLGNTSQLYDLFQQSKIK